VLGADGKLYDIGNAPAWMEMVAWGDAFVRKHDRWGPQYTQVWSHPLSAGRSIGRWSEGYNVGRDAGKLILSAPTVLFEGNILAEVVNGERQTNTRADGATDGYKLAQHTVAKAGSLVLGRYGTFAGAGLFDTDVKIGNVADVTDGMETGDALSDTRIGTAWFDATRLNEAGLGGVKLETRGAIAVETGLTLANGGSVELVAPTIDIAANITARSGSISATNWFAGGTGRGDADALRDANGGALIILSEGASLDVRGLWVNTALNSGDTNRLGFLDGGDVCLASTR
jgi:hypothetical protein